MNTLRVLMLLLLLTPIVAQNKETTQFFSLDGLELTADIYLTSSDKSTPFIVLFHQAGWSRGEYLETAPRLNEMGFNVMALDQRSGGSVNGIANESFATANAADLGTTFVDALQDIEAAVNYARTNYASNKLIIFGSSYSSALVLKLAGDKPDIADGVISFSPGEYFGRFGKSDHWIQDSAVNIKVPVFISSAGNEASSWQAFFEVIESEKISYLPETGGNHGSRSLWSEFADSEAYWQALTKYLDEYFPR